MFQKTIYKLRNLPNLSTSRPLKDSTSDLFHTPLVDMATLSNYASPAPLEHHHNTTSSLTYHSLLLQAGITPTPTAPLSQHSPPLSHHNINLFRTSPSSSSTLIPGVSFQSLHPLTCHYARLSSQPTFKQLHPHNFSPFTRVNHATTGTHPCAHSTTASVLLQTVTQLSSGAVKGLGITSSFPPTGQPK